MLDDMQVVLEKGFVSYKEGKLKLKDLKLLMEFIGKVGFMENRKSTYDQRQSWFKSIFRDLVRYEIDREYIKKGLNSINRVYSNSLWTSWPIFNQHFDYDCFKSCGSSIAPQWIKQKGLYIFVTQMGHRVPVYYPNDDKLGVIVATNHTDGALCAMPEVGSAYCKFVNRNTDKFISMELIKTPEEIYEELGPEPSYWSIFKMIGKEMNIYDHNVCYYKCRSATFIRIDSGRMVL